MSATRRWLLGAATAPLLAGSTATTDANIADRVAPPSTVNASVDFTVTDAGFWLRPMRTTSSTERCSPR